MRPPRLAAPGLLLGLLLLAPAALAFGSVEKGKSPHDEITAVAAELGWPEEAVEALQAGVRQPDIDDLRLVEVEDEDGEDEERLDVSTVFRPWHHCDREPPGNDTTALQATIGYVAQQRAIAANLSLVDPVAAVRALGRALHALQDCFSHSNAVDLPPAVQAQLQAALLGKGPAPAGLVLCGSQPGLADIGDPPGDHYPHTAHNKDDHDSSPEAARRLPDGRTKHEAAFALAQDATRAFLQEFTAQLPPDDRERLLAVELDLEKHNEGLKDIPAPWLGLSLGALAAALALARWGR